MQAHKKNWSHYLSLYTPPTQKEKDHRYQCYHLWAKYQLTQDITELYPAVHFWNTGLTVAPSCDIVFKELLTVNKLGYIDVWKRIEEALKNKQVTLLELLSDYLAFEDNKILNLWIKIDSNPKLISSLLSSHSMPSYKDSHLQIIKKMMTYGMIKLIKNDVFYASDVYPKLLKHYSLSPHQKNDIAKAFSISFAKKHHFLAEYWFSQVSKPFEDTEFLTWKIRYRLYKKDWVDVLNSLAFLSPEEATQARWIYWKARALDALGEKSQGLALFQKIFHQQNFYGFLAHHYCNQSLPLSIEHTPITSASLKHFHQHPTICRIKELFKLDRIPQAKREWLYTTSLLTEEEKIEAAHFAHHMQWHDLAIATLSTNQDNRTIMLRFPLAHEHRILHESKKNDLDPAWIFAVTRQESSFMPHAQSPVGAIGLMQLMPRTAQEIAKALKIKYNTNQDLINVNLNIELGTHYLKNLHGSMKNNPILATASYNAGPGRIKQWLPNHSMPADIWIENIPFEETRHYVQNVITYTGIYRHILGQGIHLENILLDISS